MQYRLFRGFTALSGHLKDARWRLIKKASIFGDPLAETSSKTPNPASIVRITSGERQLVIPLREDQGIPEAIKLGERTFDLLDSEEKELEPEERRFEAISKKFSKSADKLIDRFGMKIALKVAKWNSRLDILTSLIVLGVEISLSAVVLVGLSMAIIKSNVDGLIQKLKEQTDSAQLAVNIGVAGVSAFAAFVWLKQFLDDTQQVLVNRVKVKLHTSHPEKYKDFLELENKYTEKEIGSSDDNFFYAMVREVPIIGKFFGSILDEYYNIKFELREISALKDMERFISNLE